jgi:chitin disaccharide deacetylase
MKLLIVNADDFGYSYSINRGIVESHVKGIVTSTSVYG